MSSEDRPLVGVSNVARQRVIDRLTDAYVRDFINQEEFEKRVELAHSTKSRGTLAELVDDLPEDAASGAAAAPAQGTETVPVNRGEVRASETLVSIMSGVTRKGTWYPARKLKIFTLMGGVDLDFTEAVFAPGVTEISITCFMGGIDVRVPEGVNVDMRCIPIMGGVENHVRQKSDHGAPTLRLSGFVIMGGVDVKPPKKHVLRKIMDRLFGGE